MIQSALYIFAVYLIVVRGENGGGGVIKSDIYLRLIILAKAWIMDQSMEILGLHEN